MPATKPVRLSALHRRQQLVTVAIDLFSQKGFNGTTTREIAAAAGVTEAIIFRHFKTKEHLYTAIIDQRLSSPLTAVWMAGLRQSMDCNDDEAVIRQLIEAIISTHKNHPKFERLMMYAALERNEIALLYMQKITAQIVETLSGYFSRRQREGRLRAVSPDTVLIAVVGMAQHYALCKYVHSFNDPGLSDEQAIESFTRIAMNGLILPVLTLNKPTAKAKNNQL
jgi:TetR/AcrR family transcriptional regulator